MSNPSPFPFMSLPKELRLIVYFLVPPATKHLPIPLSTFTPSNPSCLKLVHISQPFLPLLLTCRQIHHECFSTLYKKASLLARDPIRPIRIIATTTGLSHDRLLRLVLCIALTTVNCSHSNDIRYLATTIEPHGHDHSTRPLASGTPKRHVDIAIIRPSIRANGFRGTRQALEQDMLDLGFDLKYCGVEREKLALDVRVRAAGLEGKEEEDVFGEIEAPRTAARGTCWFVRGGRAIDGEEWAREWVEG